MIEHVTPAPAVSFSMPAPVIEDVTPAPAVTCATQVPVIEHVAPAPVIAYVAPAPPVTISSPVSSYLQRTPWTTGLVNPRCSTTAVEDSAPQVVGSISSVDEFATPVYNQVQQFLLMTEGIEKLCGAAETAVESVPPLDEIVLLAKGTTEQQGRVPWKRRRIPTPLILEEGTDVRRGVDGVRDGYIWAGAWHPLTLAWVPPDTCPALQAASCASCAYVHTLYIAAILRDARLAFSDPFYEITRCLRPSFVFSWLSRPRGVSDEDPPVLRSGHARDVQRARHERGVPGCSVSFASGRTTVIATDSGDGLSRSVSFYLWLRVAPRHPPFESG